MTDEHEVKDDGASLMELLVVMFILSIIIITTVTLTIGMHRTTAQVINRQEQVDIGRTAVERMSKVLRTAVKPSQLISSCPGCTDDAFIRAEGFTIQFYANLDNPENTIGPSRVSYSVALSGPDVGLLVEKVQKPDSATPTSTGYHYCSAEATGASAACKARLTTRKLATGVRTTTGTGIFAYFDEQGALLSSGSGALTASDIGKLLSVEMTLTVLSTNPVQPQPTTYIQRVLLPNSQAVLRPW